MKKTTILSDRETYLLWFSVYYKLKKAYEVLNMKWEGEHCTELDNFRIKFKEKLEAIE